MSWVSRGSKYAEESDGDDSVFTYSCDMNNQRSEYINRTVFPTETVIPLFNASHSNIKPEWRKTKGGNKQKLWNVVFICIQVCTLMAVMYLIYKSVSPSNRR
ncbi:unknown [Cercopithecine alphaherpesvirus 9]|uniref:Uncharacterized protein n=2 Tax=Cercopithecine alphaherpesvirus 9 TaxID=35246 RepID=A0A2D0TCK8_CHV9D|nr:membrane protein V1 [Cercopithecine alphaherpesvirus 9]AAF36994.1 unknown [Cercopithecine alphaherpesvirus 9]AAG27182.1 unknown [Cercopithecine alphaherpesvirus 9]